MNNFDSISIRPALIQLGRVMGGAFAFTFSIGTYLAKQSEDIQPRDMPLFTNFILIYIVFFAFITISPFIISSLNIMGVLFFILVLGCFILSFFCLAYIPFAYEMIRTKYYPGDVLSYLQTAAVTNIEKSKDYTASWRSVIEITRVCNKIYKYDVDLFSNGIGRLINILQRGVELYEERKEIYLNNKEIEINEWIRLLRVRIMWLGQEVIEYPLAFERIIVQVRYLMKYPEIIFDICYFLCDFAHQKGQQESLEKGLYYFKPWCEQNNYIDRLQVLLDKINAASDTS